MAESKLASTRERVITRLARLDQTRREILFATLLLLCLLAVGTVGYALIEGWAWMDGLYMTFITLTTIGFGEVGSLSTIGRFFTIFIALVGIGSVAFVAARSAQLLLASESLHKRRVWRKIKTMHDHYIICGVGRIGRRIATDLQREGKSFVVIDWDAAKVEALQENGAPGRC